MYVFTMIKMIKELLLFSKHETPEINLHIFIMHKRKNCKKFITYKRQHIYQRQFTRRDMIKKNTN